jgi:opacity protein-like surface antigen
MKKIFVLATAIALTGLSTSAMAAGGFIRGEVGRSHVSADVDGFGSDSDNDSSYSIRGGYYFNDNFAVEGFYSNLYDKSQDGVSGKLSAIGIGLVGKKNFGADNTGFFIDGRAGIARGKIELSFDGESGSDTSTKPYFGVGAGYDFSKNLGVSLNWDYLKGSGDGLSITAKPVTLGVEYRF